MKKIANHSMNRHPVPSCDSRQLSTDLSVDFDRGFRDTITIARPLDCLGDNNDNHPEEEPSIPRRP